MDVALQFAIEMLLPAFTIVAGSIVGFSLLAYFVTSLFQFISNQ